MKIQNILVDGVYNWEIFEKLWDLSISQYLKINMKDCPVLFTEKPYNDVRERQK